ncbi:MAG: S9 family peptidase, partial [Bacteroidales bacterium]|nr:S9 family peptidase [Bacteroidales bacterium]
ESLQNQAVNKNKEDLNMGYDTNPAYSPDGKKVSWMSMERDGYESDRTRLCVKNLESGEKTYVTEKFESGVDDYIWADDSTLYFIGVWHGTTQIYRTDLSGDVCKVTDGQHDFGSVAISDGKLIAKRHSMMLPDDIYSVDIKSGVATQLSFENKHILDKLALGQVKERWVKTTDGKQMLSWVVYPPHFDSTKTYPTLLFCEGGPQSPVSQFWSYRWNFQIMAANGYIIIAPNRRGLPGFGMQWLEQISGDYAGQCMKDYLSAIDDIAKEPYVDREHLGCVGASFGGFSVYWLAGNHNKRFKAFIAHDGIFNEMQQYVETEEMWFANWDLGGAFWRKDLKTAQNTFAHSPHMYVDKWDTPILCIHGEKDYRILASQGESAFNAARMRGIDAELLLYPDENHWVLKPQNGILWQRTFFEWLDRYLKTDK